GVAFTRHDDSGTMHAFWIDGRTSEIVQLTRGERMVAGVHPRTGELLLRSPDLTWFDPITHRERPGPKADVLDATHVALSPSARWLVYQRATDSREVWRTRLDPPAPAERIYSSATKLRHAAIDDNGHVVLAAESWSGDIYVVPAAAGERF